MKYTHILKRFLKATFVLSVPIIFFSLYIILSKNPPQPLMSAGILDEPDKLSLDSKILRLASKFDKKRYFIKKWFFLKEYSSEDNLILRCKLEEFFIKDVESLDKFSPHLFVDGKEAKFVNKKKFLSTPLEDVSLWSYRMERGGSLFYIDASTLTQNVPSWRKKKDGLFLWHKWHKFSKNFYLPEDSLIEIVVTASSRYSMPKDGSFDFRAGYTISIDGKEKISHIVSYPPEYEEKSYRFYLPLGEHTIKISFDNPYHNPEQKIHRVLLLKKVVIYRLQNNIYLKTKKFPAEVELNYYSVSLLREENILYSFFLDKFLKGNLKTSLDTPDLIGLVKIKGEIHKAIFSPPYTKISRELLIPKGGFIINVRYGILPECWDKPGDGVNFKITLYPQSGGEYTLFSRYINPKENKRDRRWFFEAIDLSKFRGQKVKIIFETFGSSDLTLSVGPPDNSYDYAVFAS